MVDDLFRLSRIHSGLLNLNLELVSLDDVVSDALTLVRPMAKAKGVHVVGQVEEGSAKVRLSTTEFLRILRNLLENALRHTPAGGEVSLQAHASDDETVMTRARRLRRHRRGRPGPGLRAGVPRRRGPEPRARQAGGPGPGHRPGPGAGARRGHRGGERIGRMLLYRPPARGRRMTQETDGLAAPMIPVAEARLFVLSACKVLTPVQLDVHDAHGHVLGENVLATTDVPPFANSSMDGYAVRAADTASAPVSLRVVASVMAGDDARRLVSPGESVRIMTGAPLPPGADAVCMVERTRLESGGSIVVVEESVEPGTFVRKAGSDVRAGDEVFSPGTYLGAAHVGVLSSIGVERLLVHPSPTVGVLSTGDELSHVERPAGSGKDPGRQPSGAPRPTPGGRLRRGRPRRGRRRRGGPNHSARRGRLPLRRHRLERGSERR